MFFMGGLGFRARLERRRGGQPIRLKYDGKGATDDFRGLLQKFFLKTAWNKLKKW